MLRYRISDETDKHEISSSFFYPDTMHLNIDAIDKTLYNESQRYNNLEIPKHSNSLILKALGVTKFDKKEIQGSLAFII